MARVLRSRRARTAAGGDSSSAGDGATTRRRFPTVRLGGVLVLVCMVPLALLTYFTVQLADRAVVHEVDARVQTTAVVTAALLQRQMLAVAELTASYGNRRLLVNAMGDGKPDQFDTVAILQQLTQLEAADPAFRGAFVTDSSCRLTHVEPATPAIVGVDFSFRDWCRGVQASGAPYVSEAYRTAIVGEPLVVAVAVFVRSVRDDDIGRPLGIVGVTYSLDALGDFADSLARAHGLHLLITDQRGSVLVGNSSHVRADGLPSARSDPRVGAALAGRSGSARSTGAQGDRLSAFAPVGDIGWTVTAEVPADEALAGVRGLRATALSVAGGLALLLLAGIVLLARALRQRRETYRLLRDSEAYTRAIVEAATDAFVSIDDRGFITGWNGEATRTFGWTESEALGAQVFATLVPVISGRSSKGR